MKLTLLVAAICATFSTYTYAGFVCTSENEQALVSIMEQDALTRVMIQTPLFVKGLIRFTISKLDAINYETSDQSVNIYNKDEPYYEFNLKYDFNSQVGSLYINLEKSGLILKNVDINCEKR